MVWYSHLFQNFPQFIVIYTLKGFGVANKAEVDVFLELSCFFDVPTDVGNLISGSSAFSETSLKIWIKGTERKFEGHEEKHHGPESPLPRIRHTEVLAVEIGRASCRERVYDHV